MEQKHEQVEKEAGPRPGMWLPWLNLETRKARATPVTDQASLEGAQAQAFAPPLPSQLVAPPNYFEPTELNLQLYQMGQETSWREACLIGLWTCLVPLLSLCTLVALYNHQNWGALGSGALLAFLLHYNRQVDTLIQTREALSLSHVGKDGIGSFIEALLWPNSRIQGIAAIALTNLLPQLTPEDASLLTTQHREILYTRLHALGVKTDLRIAILKALAVIGDEHAIPQMEHLADTFAWTPRQARVRTAAREALGALEERLAQKRQLEADESPALAEEGVLLATVELSQEEQQVRSQQTEELLKQIEEEMRSGRKPSMRIGFLIANWVVIVPYLGTQAIKSLLLGHDRLETLILTLLCLASTQMYRFTLFLGQSKAARELANSDNIQAVGRLAEVLDWPDRDVQFAAHKALVRLLPQLRATDSHLLNEKQRHVLYKSLKISKSLKMRNAAKEEALILAILKALEQVGDNEAIPYVERLAQHTPMNARETRIRDKAVECLPYLVTRAHANESSKVLLRASAASEMSPEALLRPANANQAEAAEQLLRPSTDEG